MLVNRIVRNQVHIGQAAAVTDQFSQFKRVLSLVIDVFEHDIFECDPAVSPLQIVVNGPHQLLNRNGTVDLHNSGTNLIVRRMQGDRQIHTQIGICEFLDLVRQATGGYGDVSRRNREPLLILHNLNEVHHIRKIVKRLANPHYYDMADPLALPGRIQMQLDLHNLLHNFPAG
ncbi:hypothetical protein D3C81_927430 [compost metagenome]